MTSSNVCYNKRPPNNFEHSPMRARKRIPPPPAPSASSSSSAVSYTSGSKVPLKSLARLKEDLDGDELWLLELGKQETLDVIYANAMTLAASEIQSIQMQPGDTAPDFILPDVRNNDVAVSSRVLRSRGPLVVTFLGNSTGASPSSPHSPKTLFSKQTEKQILKWEACGATVVTISPNFSASCDQNGYDVTGKASSSILLRDGKDHRVGQMFRNAFSLDGILKDFFREHSSDRFVDEYGEGHDEVPSYVLALPATYVIGPQGQILYSHVDTSTYTSEEANVQDVLSVLPPCNADTNLKRLRDKLILKEQQLVEEQPEMEHERELCKDAIARLVHSGIAGRALQCGDLAPDFKLRSATSGEWVQTRKLREGYLQTLIVMFYRGRWCPFCNTTLEAMKEYVPKYAKKGATLLAISPQTMDNSIRTTLELNIKSFSLLSDENNELAEQFRIAYALDRSLEATIGAKIDSSNEGSMMSTRQDFVHDDNYDFVNRPRHKLPLCATYVINRLGQIIYSVISCDETDRAEPEEILKALPPPPSGAAAAAVRLMEKHEKKRSRSFNQSRPCSSPKVETKKPHSRIGKVVSNIGKKTGLKGKTRSNSITDTQSTVDCEFKTPPKPQKSKKGPRIYRRGKTSPRNVSTERHLPVSTAPTPSTKAGRRPSCNGTSGPVLANGDVHELQSRHPASVNASEGSTTRRRQSIADTNHSYVPLECSSNPVPRVGRRASLETTTPSNPDCEQASTTAYRAGRRASLQGPAEDSSISTATGGQKKAPKPAKRGRRSSLCALQITKAINLVKANCAESKGTRNHVVRLD